MSVVGMALLEVGEILQLVAQMRKAQKDYFKGRKQSNLIESKQLETAVDMKLGELGIKAV